MRWRTMRWVGQLEYIEQMKNNNILFKKICEDVIRATWRETCEWR